MMLVCMMVTGGGVAAALHEGTLVDALRTLIMTRSEIAQRAAFEKAKRMDVELKAVTESNNRVQVALNRLLFQNPKSIRARFSIFHNGVVTTTQLPVLKYDVMSGVAVRGRGIGDMYVNVPLSVIGEYMPDLIAGRCISRTIKQIPDGLGRERALTLGVVSFQICPVSSPTGQLFGFVSLMQDTVTDTPTATALPGIYATMQSAAVQIGEAYSLRPVSLP